MNQRAYQTIAKMLREFGYPDVTSEMIEDTHKAMSKSEPLPHGVIGMFAEKYLKELEEQGALSPI